MRIEIADCHKERERERERDGVRLLPKTDLLNPLLWLFFLTRLSGGDLMSMVILAVFLPSTHASRCQDWQERRYRSKDSSGAQLYPHHNLL